MAILKEKVGLSNADMRKLRSMRPGMPLDLQLVTPTATKRVRTEFIGMDGARALILQFPDEAKWGNLRDAIYPDNTMVVRYILEDEAGEIVAFRVKITLVLSKPGNYVFTSFPTSIQCHPLRNQARAQTQIPVKVVNADDKQNPLDGRVIDISPGGCRVSAVRKKNQHKFTIKQTVILLISRGASGTETLTGQVMNVRSDEVHTYYGIKFDDQEGKVEALMAQLMIV